jgi:DNA replication protein DnaC
MTNNLLSETQRLKLRERGILDKWHGRTLDDFKGDPIALENVRKYLSNHKKATLEGVGLFLWGSWGSGKTMLMNALMQELHKMKYPVKVITLATLITQFSQGWYDSEERDKFLRGIQQVKFLAIDDLGKEYKGASDFGLRVFDNLLRFRSQMNLPTIFTANIEPKEIKDYYSEGVASMLQEMCAMVKVTGDDFRKKFAERNKRLITK